MTTLPEIATRLLATALLTLLGASIAVIGAMSRPAPRRVTAVTAAVAVEGMSGGGRDARSPSAGKFSAAAYRVTRTMPTNDSGPRVKPHREAATSRRGIFI